MFEYQGWAVGVAAAVSSDLPVPAGSTIRYTVSPGVT